MKRFAIIAAAACFSLSGAVQAATINISEFNITTFGKKTSSSGFVVQDFEDVFGDGSQVRGQLGGPLSTNVGVFSAITTDANGVEQVGDGTTCGASNGSPCDKLFLNDQTTNGQGNIVPDNGNWSLNANDTFGIAWDVIKGEGGSMFNRVVFGIMDAADIGNTVVTFSVTATDLITGAIETVSGLNNAQQKLIVIDFANLTSGANIEIRSSKLNDSFSIDGASVGVVPLPAGGLLLLTGLGALALRRRRQAVKAA